MKDMKSVGSIWLAQLVCLNILALDLLSYNGNTTTSTHKVWELKITIFAEAQTTSCIKWRKHYSTVLCISDFILDKSLIQVFNSQRCSRLELPID